MKMLYILLTTVLTLNAQATTDKNVINLNEFSGKTFTIMSDGCSLYLKKITETTIAVSSVISHELYYDYINRHGNANMCEQYRACNATTHVLNCNLITGACASFNEPTLWLLPDKTILAYNNSSTLKMLAPSFYDTFTHCR
jgi:hypothetical protein